MSHQVFNNSFEPYYIKNIIFLNYMLIIYPDVRNPLFRHISFFNFCFIISIFVSPFPYSLFCFALILGLTYKRECKLFCCDMLVSLLLPHVLGLSQPAALVALSQCILLLLFCPSALCASFDGTQSPLLTNSLSHVLSASHIS